MLLIVLAARVIVLAAFLRTTRQVRSQAAWQRSMGAIAALALLCCPFQAVAKSRDDSLAARELAGCIRSAARGQPWLEKTLWGLRDQEGGWIGAEILNTNGSHDLGPLQVNSWWVPKLALATGRPDSHVRWWLTHDACFNVSAARWIFLSGLAITRDYWVAIGVYHSPTEWRQRRYAASVADHLRNRFGPNIFRGPRSSGPRQFVR